MTHQSIKLVTDPICGIIDFSRVLPMVEAREFQALADKRQLGMTYLVFRSALHTRFNHCLGAYYAMCILADKWLLQGVITKEERDALVAYALYHDIGHPAFSHVTEDFCELDDDEMTVDLIQNILRGVIEACGINSELVEALAKHENPLYLAVHDKNLGMEKLDYLERDGFYTLNSRPPGIDYLRNYIYFVDGRVAIDEKVVEHALDTTTFYMKMYKEVYFRKALVVAQRMFHKAVYHLILAKELFPPDLPGMTDSELLALMITSQDNVVRDMYRCLRERKLFKEAIVIRSEELVGETRVADKDIKVFGVSREDMGRLVEAPLLQKKNQAGLTRLEDTISEAAGLPKGNVLVVPVFNPERFRAKDVMIYGSDKKLHSLRERRPAHFDSMEETARSYAALRICVREEYRRVMSSPKIAKEVLRLVLAS